MHHKTVYRKLNSTREQFLKGVKYADVPDLFGKLFPRRRMVFEFKVITPTTEVALSTGGFYDFDDDIITIVLYFWIPTEMGEVEYMHFGSDTDFQNFIIDLMQTITHEMIHRKQHKKRYGQPGSDYRPRSLDITILEKRVDKKSQIRYYGSPDELDARAHDMALEIYYEQEQYTLGLYRNLFGSTHPVTKKLMKRAQKWLKEM